jgi:hypothetical protein
MNLKFINIIPIENDNKKSFLEIIKENERDFLKEPDYFFTVSINEYLRLFNANPEFLHWVQKISELVHE